VEAGRGGGVFLVHDGSHVRGGSPTEPLRAVCPSRNGGATLQSTNPHGTRRRASCWTAIEVRTIRASGTGPAVGRIRVPEVGGWSTGWAAEYDRERGSRHKLLAGRRPESGAGIREPVPCQQDTGAICHRFAPSCYTADHAVFGRLYGTVESWLGA
jgi:hypothetical protein